MLNLPLDVQAQEKKRKVIFVVHDLNPFFVPAIVGMKNFGALAGWDTQFIGPPDTRHAENGGTPVQCYCLEA